MHAHAPLEHLVFHNRWRHSSAARKTAAGGSLLFLACVLPVGYPLIAIGVLSALLVIAGARIPLAAWTRYLAPQFCFLLAATLPVAFRDPQGAASIALRGVIAASTATVISLTTPVPDVLDVLRRWRFPKTFVDLSFLVYRLGASTLAMLDATLVGHRIRTTGSRLPLSMTASSAGLLLARTLRLGQRLEHGANARCVESLVLLSPSRRTVR